MSIFQFQIKIPPKRGYKRVLTYEKPEIVVSENVFWYLLFQRQNPSVVQIFSTDLEHGLLMKTFSPRFTVSIPYKGNIL